MDSFESISTKIKEKKGKVKESLAYTSKVLNLFSTINTEDYS